MNKPLIIVVIAASLATSIYTATLSNPTQPQKDLGRTANQIFFLGSQSLLKDQKRK